jgi:hypothetical protein
MSTGIAHAGTTWKATRLRALYSLCITPVDGFLYQAAKMLGYFGSIGCCLVHVVRFSLPTSSPLILLFPGPTIGLAPQPMVTKELQTHASAS